MPNVLAHIGAQGPLSRTVFREADPRWIYLGLLVPDLPWIVRRAVHGLNLPVDPAWLQLYVTAQATLVMSLVLAGAFALLSVRPRLVFGILSLNVVLHLLLDAVERKWGNGVHLFAPLDWNLWSLDLVWPESGWILVLTLAGALFLGWHWWKGGGRTIGVAGLADIRRRAPAMGVLFVVYATVPVLWTPAVWEADVRNVRTLAEVEERPGRALEVDRDRYESDGEEGRVHVLGYEWVALAPPVPEEAGTVSLRGRFADPETLEVQDFHRHPEGIRDLLSYLGLLAIFLVWLGVPDRGRPAGPRWVRRR